MNPQIRSYFVVLGEACIPAAVTAVTGITPTKTWLKGEVRHERTQRIRLDSGWRVDLTSEVEATLEAHVAGLLNLLWESREYFDELRSRCELHISVVVHGRNGMPELNLSVDTLRRLSSIGASLDIDAYC